MTTYHLRGTDGTEVFTGTIEPPPGGGSQPVVKQAAFLFEEQATMGSESYPITAVNVGAGTYTIAGDHEDDFIRCDWFSITGSTGNDGIYVATTITLVGGNTVIQTADGIQDGTVDGAIWPSAYRASLPIPAGTIVAHVYERVLTSWAADQVEGFIFDQLDPAVISAALDGTAAPFQYVLNGDHAVQYDVDATLHMSYLTRIVNPPVVPTGRTIIYVEFWTPLVVPTESTHP